MGKWGCIIESKTCIKCNSIFYRKNTHKTIEEFEKQKYCSRKCVLDVMKRTPEQTKERNRRINKRKRKNKAKNLPDSYIKRALKKEQGLDTKDATPEIIALKRAQILLNRTIKGNKL